MLDDQITVRVPASLAKYYDEAASMNSVKPNDLHRFALQYAQSIINDVIEDKPENMELGIALMLKTQGIDCGKAKPRAKRVASTVPYSQIQTLYNGAIGGSNFVESAVLSTKAKTNIKKLYIALKSDLDKTQAYFDFCVGMLKGQGWATGDNGWRADIEYMTREQTYIDCRNGKYQ